MVDNIENGDYGGAGSTRIVMDVFSIQDLEHVAAGQGRDGHDSG